MNTFKIFLRADNKNIDGSHSLYLLFISNRRLKKISLGIKVKPKDWDEKRCLVKKSDIEFLRKNKYIRKYADKAQSIIDKYFFDDKYLSVSEFEKIFKNNAINSSSFYEFIEEEMKHLTLAPATFKDYNAQLSKLKQFRKELTFNEIDVTFIQDYIKFLKEEKGNKPNTVASTLKFLRQAINKAKVKSLTDTTPFDYIKVPQIRGNREFLTLSELKILENLLNSDDLTRGERKVLRYFLFACYTGLRYIDFKNFKYKNIRTTILNNKAYNFIEIDMHKTGTPVTIPIIPKAEKLLDEQKYRLPNKKVFNISENQPTNRSLKSIMKKAKIDKNISFHCARHTLGNVGADLGIPIEVISAILGHRAIKTTQIYSKVSKRRMVEEMEKFDKKE